MQRINSIKPKCDLLPVEGVGGVMVPLSKNFLIRGLNQKNSCEVALVATNHLGKINHSLLLLCYMYLSKVEEYTYILMEHKSQICPSEVIIKRLKI